MKALVILLLLSPSVFAGMKMEMEPGYWEYVTNMEKSPMMAEAMASLNKLPKAQRDQALAMMKKSMGAHKTYQCVTKDDLANWEKKMEENMRKNNKDDNCKFKVLISEKKKFKGQLKCKDKQKDMTFFVKMSSSKKGATEVTTSLGKDPVKMTMKWVSSKCKPKTKS